MAIFGGKNKNTTTKTITEDKVEEIIVDEKSGEQVTVIERPRICCIDLNEETITALKKSRANVVVGSLGSKIRVPKTSSSQVHYLLPDYDFPPNLHEFDIIILDLANFKTVDFKTKDHTRDTQTGRSSSFLLSRHPETLFDPRPLGSFVLRKELRHISNRIFLILAFSSADYAIDYETAELSERYPQSQGIEEYGIYSFWHFIPTSTKKFGNEITVCNTLNELDLLLEKYKIGAGYNQTFSHPTHYSANQRVYDDNFFPLMTNMNGDIISFMELNEYSNLILLPQIKDKTNFIIDFLTKVAPAIFPSLFPYSTTFNWKSEKEYWLPGHASLLGDKFKIQKEFEKRLEESEKRIEENLKNFSFLHEIISESGNKLTVSLIDYLKWLGFENVTDFDKTNTNSTVLEEDIQVQLADGLLIIECKGIGGTSTDGDCNQISKIKHRRARERNKFDVYALYIVNHQRYLPPLKRKNPPFTNHQIEDAKNDERGLLTTWQLFQLYFDIEAGIITKEEASGALLRFGHIEFRPTGLRFLYEPSEIIKDGLVCIVKINDVLLKVNDELFVEKNERFEKVRIISIRLNDVSVEQASDGELGLKLSSKIERKSRLWKRE